MQFWNAFTGLLGAAAATSTGAPTTGVDATGLSVPGEFPTTVAPSAPHVSLTPEDTFKPTPTTTAAVTGIHPSDVLVTSTAAASAKAGATLPTVTTHVPDAFSHGVTQMPQQTALAGQHNDVFDQYLHPQNAHAESSKVDWSKVDLDELFKDNVPVTGTGSATSNHGAHATTSGIATHHAGVNPLDRMFEPLGIPPLNVNKAASTTDTHEAHVTAPEVAAHTGKPDPLDEMFKEFGIGEDTASSAHHPDSPLTSELAKAPTSAASIHHEGHSANITTMEELHAHASQLGITPTDLKEAAVSQGTNTSVAGPMDELMQNLRAGNPIPSSNATHTGSHSEASAHIEDPLYQQLLNETQTDTTASQAAPHTTTEPSITHTEPFAAKPVEIAKAPNTNAVQESLRSNNSEHLSNAVNHSLIEETPTHLNASETGLKPNSNGVGSALSGLGERITAAGEQIKPYATAVGGHVVGTFNSASEAVTSRLPSTEQVKGTFNSASEAVTSRLPSTEQVKGTFNSASEAVTSRLPSAEQVKGTFNSASEAVTSRLPSTEQVKGTFNSASEAVTSRLPSAEQVKGTFNSASEAVTSRLPESEPFKAAVSQTLNTVSGQATGAFNSVSEAVASRLPEGKPFKQAINQAGGATAEAASNAWESTKEGAGKAWESTKQGAGKAWESTKGYRPTGEQIKGAAGSSWAKNLAGIAGGWTAAGMLKGKKAAPNEGEAPTTIDKPEGDTAVKPGEHTNSTADKASTVQEKPVGFGEEANKPSNTPEDLNKTDSSAKHPEKAPHKETEKPSSAAQESTRTGSREHTSSSTSHGIKDAPKEAAAASETRTTSNTTATSKEVENRPASNRPESTSKNSNKWERFTSTVSQSVESFLKKFTKLLVRIRK